MKTNRLYRIAEENGIVIDRISLPLNLSASVMCENKMYVAIDKNIRGAEERVCLAHELGHCQTASFYNIFAPLDVRGKHERRADKWAIKRLVPPTKYKNALRNGYNDIYSLAEYFDVTADFMKKAVDYYRDNDYKMQ